jgi:hypothetical protein
MHSLWQWIQDNSTGIGVVLSLVSVILTTVGFLILWIQTKKIQNSALAAAGATKDALSAIASTDTISDLSSVRERMKSVQVAIRADGFQIAAIEIQYLRESLSQLRRRRGFPVERHADIQTMLEFLSKTLLSLERRMVIPKTPIRRVSINYELARHAVRISEWMEEMRNNPGGLSDDTE